MQFQELETELLTRAQLGGHSFQLGFVFCQSPAALDSLAASLKHQLAALQPQVTLTIVAHQDSPLIETVFHEFETFQNGAIWLPLQRASDSELRTLLTRMNEMRTAVVAQVQGLLVIAMRDNFDGELGAMVSDLWAVRSFALALPIIRDIIEEPFELVDRSSSHVAIPAVEGTFPAVPMNLYEIDRILQHAEIQSRDLQPVEAIALITQALTAIIRHAPSLIAFEIIERALKLSEHLVSNPNSLSATQILLNWIHLKPEASIRVTRKHAEALIATSACALALSTLQNAQQVVSADLLARTAQAEALLGLGRDAEAVTFFEKVLKLDQRSDSAASTRCYAGLAQAFVNASAYRNAAKMLELGILALERRILRRGHAPVRAMRMARMLNLEREIDLISEKPMRKVLSAVSVLKVAVKQFGPIPALIQAIARLKPPA